MGRTCPSATSSVVLLNMRGQGIPVGACSGTIIAPRAILTAAHCLDEDVSTVQIWLGSGPQTVAASFTHFPNFRQNDPSSRDLGIVLMGEDLPRTPIPLITRDARVGETAVIAGWGQDQNTVPATHRAGTATISGVSSLFLETEFSPSASSICSGDSGGPILLSEGGVWSIAGVTSAASTAGCTTGTNFFVNLRNPVASAFILGLVPDAARR